MNNINNENEVNENENPLYNYKILFKVFNEEELNILLLRTTLNY